jgi:hypothetical protein
MSEVVEHELQEADLERALPGRPPCAGRTGADPGTAGSHRGLICAPFSHRALS